MALFWVHLPSPVGYVVWVSCEGPFHLQALFGIDCGFLLWLHCSEGFRLSSIRGYRLMLSAVFHFRLPVISFHPVLRALLHSFRVSSPSRAVLPSSSFASLRSTPLCSLVKMVLFFVALAVAVPLGKLRALPSCLFRQNTYLRNKKHRLTCQGGLEGVGDTPPPPSCHSLLNHG